MESHLPCGITQCCLPSDTGERVPSQYHSDKPTVNLSVPKGWKAELTLVLVRSIPKRFICPQTVTHPSSNHLIATQSGVKAITYRLQVWHPTVMPPSQSPYTVRSTQPPTPTGWVYNTYRILVKLLVTTLPPDSQPSKQ